jgi:hypothetical protein
MNIQSSRLTQKFLFLLGITILYLAIIAWLDFLQGPYWWDEKQFWQTSQTFSDSLLPSLADLRDYRELNTPLPFIIFGGLEYLFNGGIFAGRLLNLILSLTMVFIIGWPTKQKGARAILCLIGLFLCPYFLWLSGRLYTEMIACFWMLLGFVAYTRSRFLLSALAFILAIASRQYMVAFPAAIATYEAMVALAHGLRDRTFTWREQIRWIAPLIAALSLLGWFYLFQGLAPASAYEWRLAPEVQQSAFALEPGGAIHFLSFVGLYIVIPEFLLFQPLTKWQSIRPQWKRIGIIALSLLVFVVIFPPQEAAMGNVVKLANALPSRILQIALYYSLSLLACVRFAKFNLMGLIIFFNALIMMKAFPWDRYVLPMAVAFWYLKSIDWESKPITWAEIWRPGIAVASSIRTLRQK